MVTPFYEKEETCLYCQHRFVTTKVRSRFVRIEKVHSDFFQEYKDPEINPYLYEVAVCPKCGFAFSDQFEAKLTPNIRERIAQALKGWKEQDFGGRRDLDIAIRAYKLGILSATLKKEKHVVIAGLCLRLAWLFRMKNDEQEEKRFLSEALNQYKKSYERADYIATPMTDIRILYMIGELSRRVGNIDEAIRYFSLVIQHKDKESEQKIVEMAREQWYLIRNSEAL